LTDEQPGFDARVPSVLDSQKVKTQNSNVYSDRWGIDFTADLGFRGRPTNIWPRRSMEGQAPGCSGEHACE